MNPLYPIEQLVTRRGGGSQFAFANKACAMLPRSDDLSCEATSRGLLMLGQCECDFDEPRQFLLDAFGSAVSFLTPRVRLFYSNGWQQPIMGFRIAAEASSIPEIRRGLATRDARISDVEVGPHAGVLRGQAPLFDLIGYPRTLHRLSQGRAHATLWLSHYEPLWSYENETMACFSDG